MPDQRTPAILKWLPLWGGLVSLGAIFFVAGLAGRWEVYDKDKSEEEILWLLRVGAGLMAVGVAGLLGCIASDTRIFPRLNALRKGVQALVAKFPLRVQFRVYVKGGALAEWQAKVSCVIQSVDIHTVAVSPAYLRFHVKVRNNYKRSIDIMDVPTSVCDLDRLYKLPEFIFAYDGPISIKGNGGEYIFKFEARLEDDVRDHLLRKAAAKHHADLNLRITWRVRLGQEYYDVDKSHKLNGLVTDTVIR